MLQATCYQTEVTSWCFDCLCEGKPVRWCNEVLETVQVFATARFNKESQTGWKFNNWNWIPLQFMLDVIQTSYFYCTGVNCANYYAETWLASWPLGCTSMASVLSPDRGVFVHFPEAACKGLGFFGAIWVPSLEYRETLSHITVPLFPNKNK